LTERTFVNLVNTTTLAYAMSADVSVLQKLN